MGLVDKDTVWEHQHIMFYLWKIILTYKTHSLKKKIRTQNVFSSQMPIFDIFILCAS